MSTIKYMYIYICHIDILYDHIIHMIIHVYFIFRYNTHPMNGTEASGAHTLSSGDLARALGTRATLKLSRQPSIMYSGGKCTHSIV